MCVMESEDRTEQSRAEQSPLDDVLSKICLPVCVLEDHRINVFTHT